MIKKTIIIFILLIIGLQSNAHRNNEMEYKSELNFFNEENLLDVHLSKDLIITEKRPLIISFDNQENSFHSLIKSPIKFLMNNKGLPNSIKYLIKFYKYLKGIIIKCQL